MGCTPSHSDIANHHANHGIKHLNKGILPVDPRGESFSLPLLIKGSSSYDIDDMSQGDTQVKDHFLENVSEEDKNVYFHSSSEDPSLPELDQEEKETAGTISEAEIAISGLTESQKHTAEERKVRKQNSFESKEVGFDLDDKNENNEKQIPKKAKKQKNTRQGKQGRNCKTKEKSSPSEFQVEKKVDFPDLLVKAHQNAYAYLNPNLSKYEVILCMANQATETQLILQQMVSFLLFRFDEINHLLEEIAQDGEDLLKEVGGNLAWPAVKGSSQEQPDLLQQLLQYTVNKMHLLNRTVASLTSDALQESCSFLQSAGSSLEVKLKAKQGFDERLSRTIKLLESSAVKSSPPRPDDMTLYSEDSGIGIDSESVKDLNILDKQGMQMNCGSCAHAHPSQNQTRVSGEHQCTTTTVYATTRSHDCALERHFKDIFYQPSYKKCVSSLEIVPESSATVSQHQNINQALSLTSVPSSVIHEGDCFKECKSTDVFSTNEDSDDNTLSEEEEDDNISLSETIKNALPKRPTSPSVAVDSKRRLSIKCLESSENEEIILKMKDAISEKIKFVPAKSGKREWLADENGRGSPRPRTATESQKTQVKKKRSKSEESLRSPAEDPTLLELQRTQKGLSKRLEMFYTLKGNKETKDKPVSTSPKEPFNLQDCEHITHRSSIKKLKASLSKNFSILPNQDKAPLLKYDQNAISQQPDEMRRRKPFTATTSSQDRMCRKENQPPETQKLNSVACTPPRKSVKKLIETFSPPESLVKPGSLRPLGPIKCIRKFGLPSIPPSFPVPRGLVPLSHKHRVSPLGEIYNPIHNPNFNTTRCAFGGSSPPVFASESDTNEETEDDGDMENFPPPPPEMLRGISWDSTESLENTGTKENCSKAAKKNLRTNEHCTARKISQISQRMKASLSSMDLLPSKNLNSLNPIAKKASKNTGVNPTLRKYSLESNATLMSDYIQESSITSQRYHEIKETAELYKESQKIIPLPNTKEMPEQNENDLANKECSIPVTLAQKQISPDSLGGSGKAASFIRRMSPARTPPSSPPSEKRIPSPPLHQRHSRQAFLPVTHRQPSPPASPRTSSPPVQRKVSSPPTQQNLSSPPLGRKQQSPLTRSKVSSPPVHRREESPPPFWTSPSPPSSPSQLRKGLQNHLDSGEEQQSASPKIVTNVCSIFCPATSSLFEAKPLLPPNSCATEVIIRYPEDSAFSQRNSTQLRQHGDPQRRMALSATNPQPFVRRSLSDRRPGFQLPPPLFASSGSEPVLSKTSMEESPRKDGDSWNEPCFSEGKGAGGKSSSHPELYIVGQGLQKD